MRIAFVCPPNPNMVRPSYLGRLLAQRGHEVHVVIPPSEKQPELYGLEKFPVPVHRCPAGESPRRAVIAQLTALQPDVVHCIDCARSTLPATLTYAAHSHALSIVDMPDWMSKWARWRSKLAVALEYWALARADAVAVASEELLGYYQRRRHHARLYYLPFAVDLEFFAQERRRATHVRARYGDLKLLTYLGALVPEYSPMESLEMARALARRRQDFRLLYVGRGPYQPTLQAQAEAWGIADKVEFTGFVAEEELPGYLAASDVLLCPLEDNLVNRNRCPNKAFWYLGAGRPIVATPVGEVHRALGDEALYYRYGDPEDFADQVEKALRGEAPIPSAERAAAHSWPAVTDRYEALLAELRGGRAT
jgi:glycosyltransferase involved in cell wall biosynthesis